MNQLLLLLLAADPPNILVILADDQGWGDLSVHGNPNVATPNIDSLARDGALFERFYVQPVCSPTRAEFLTGRHHLRGGVRGVNTGGERLDLDEKTIADLFHAAGYATGAFGKWHNGTQYPYHPNGRGFQEFYGFTSGHWGHYFDADMDHNGRSVKGKGYIVDDVTDHAIAFIEKSRGKPFFCYVAYNTPHSPFQVPDRFYDRFKGKPLEPDEKAALAMCENIDENVGRLLRAVMGDTIVLYFSDNGPNSARWNGGMKGRKGSTDEGGVRSPLLVRWPGRIKPGTRIAQIAAAIDLLPTLADLTGVRAPAGLDGLSLKPLLLGTADAWPDRMIFSHWGGRVSVRTQGHRLDAAGNLFDLTADPGQQRAVEQPELQRRLADAVQRWKADLTLAPDDRPFPVGHRAFPATPLPARDGVPHGAVRRSANAPNCSFFTNWTKPEDRITWDIEVATARAYEAVLYYTCPKDDVGSSIELSFGAARLEGRVSEAHDPPLLGAEHDRVPRKGESYVKDFKPLKLGRLDLKPGRGPLTLRATSVPGRLVMDLRLLLLTRID